MKKLICFLLTALVLLQLCACSEQGHSAPLQLYYRTADVSHAEGLIGSEAAAASVERTAKALADRYFQGPQQDTLTAPFPKGTEVRRATISEDTLSLYMSRELATLSGVDLTLALSCISMTFTQLEGVEAVTVSTELDLLGGQQSITIRDGDILLRDNSLEMAETKLTVYYADQDNRYLIPVEVGTKLETTAEQAAYAISLLAAEPEQDHLSKTMPKNVEILDLSIENEVCIIDFSDDFYRNRYKNQASERMTVLSIVNTLTEFDEISAVQIFVEGQSLKTYSYMDLSIIYVRDESAIGPVRSGLSEVDASIYVLRENDMTLTELPFRMKSAANETDADAVLAALLSFGSMNGYISAVPEETEVLSVQMDGSHCHIDLSASFASKLETAEEEENAVNAIVKTALSLENIRWVSITIEGQPSGLSSVDLEQTFR